MSWLRFSAGTVRRITERCLKSTAAGGKAGKYLAILCLCTRDDTDPSNVFLFVDRPCISQEPVSSACLFYLSGRRYFTAANSPICLPMAMPTSLELR